MYEYSPTAYDAVDTERLLYIHNNERNNEYGHVIATVVRRDKPSLIITDWDGRIVVNSYRNTDWSAKKKNAYFVGGISLEGQYNRFDSNYEYSSKKGDIYGNRLICKETTSSKQLSDALRTFKKFESVKNNINENTDISDFLLDILVFAKVTGITKIVIDKDPWFHASLSNGDDFEEFDLDSVPYENIEQILLQIAV